LDKKALLIALIWGFLPIIVYIVVEAEYGPILGMAAAFVWSLGEMAFIFIRERRLEKILLFDVGLIAILGLISILFDDEFFFKLKPAIFEIVFVVIIGVSKWTGLPIIQNMTRRQIRQTGLQPDFDNPQFQKMLSGMFFLMLVHVIAVIWAAYFASTEMWGFISGALLYIVLGIWFASQILPKFIMPIWWKFKYKNDEWLPVIESTSGRIKFTAPRKIVHRNKNWLHPVVHVNIFNRKNEWYLQKRAIKKEVFPGYWDVSVGGHVETGERIYDAAVREAREEVGYVLNRSEKPDLVFSINLENESELIHVYFVHSDEKLVPDKNEIMDGKFWSEGEITDILKADKDLNSPKGNSLLTPALIAEYKYLMQNDFWKKSGMQRFKTKKGKKKKR